MNKVDKAKQCMFQIWSTTLIVREYVSNENLDAFIESWEQYINKFEIEDFDEAVYEIRDDMITERRGRDLDRPSLPTLLSYCKAAKNQRILRTPEPEKIDTRTPEEKAAHAEHGRQVLADLKKLFQEEK